jgi:bile acid:Na+ symporter, BASS family
MSSDVAMLFNALFNGGLVVCITFLVASLGMKVAPRAILAEFKHGWVVLGAIVLNVVLAPLIAIGVCTVLPLSGHAATGIEIVTIASAGPAGLEACKLVKRADMAMALALVIVLQLLNIAAAPLWANQIISGATVDVWSIVTDLLVLVLIPLAVGMICRARYPEHVDRWGEGVVKISNIGLYIALVAGIALNWHQIVDALGSWVIVASVLIYVAYFVLGYAIGFRNRPIALATANVSAMRFTPIGLIVIATVLNNESAYLVPALIFALIDTIVPFAGAAEMGRYLSRKDATKGGGEVAPAGTLGA